MPAGYTGLTASVAQVLHSSICKQDRNRKISAAWRNKVICHEICCWNQVSPLTRFRRPIFGPQAAHLDSFFFSWLFWNASGKRREIHDFYYTYFDRVTFRRSVKKFEKASSNKGTTNNYDWYNSCWICAYECEWGKWKISLRFDRKASKEKSVANRKRQGVLLVRQTDRHYGVCRAEKHEAREPHAALGHPNICSNAI